MQQQVNQKKRQPARFVPIFLQMGALHFITTYLLYPRSRLKMLPLLSLPLKQKIIGYTKYLLERQLIVQYLHSGIFGLLYKGALFSMFDHLTQKKIHDPQNEISNSSFFVNGALSGAFGALCSKFPEYFNRIYLNIAAKGYVYLQIFHFNILKQNIKDILTDKPYFQHLIREVPYIVIKNCLCFGIFYSITEKSKQIRSSEILKMLAAFGIIGLSDIILTPAYNHLKIKADFKEILRSSLRQKMRYFYGSSINTVSILHQAFLFYFYDAVIHQAKGVESE